MGMIEHWKYIKYREDIDDHCQYCNKETNKLHWFRIDEHTVATLCDTCYQKLKEGA